MFYPSWAGRLAALMVSLCLYFGAVAVSVAETRLALLVGNAAYIELPVLRNPGNDVRLLEQSLRQLSFETTVVLDQTGAELRTALSDFNAKVRAAAAGDSDVIALFYYAGHAVQLDGTNYLLPVDVSGKNESDIIIDGISAQASLRALELTRPDVSLVVLDACRNAPFSSARGFARGLARMSAATNSLIAYSTAPDQTAADGDGLNSPYAAALAKAILVPGSSIEVVFRSVRIEVTRVTGGAQTPWEETSLTRELILAPLAGAQASPSQSQRAYLQAVAINTVEAYDAFLRRYPDAEEARKAIEAIAILTDEKSWSEARAADTVERYRLYTAQHPTGVHAEEARNRIAALSAEADAWQRAMAADTPRAYTEFLIAHPDSRRATEARGRMAALADEAAWRRATSHPDPATGYRDYLAAYPAGIHVTEASRRLGQAQADNSAWTEAQRRNSAEGYRRYVERFPSGRHAAEARRQIAALEARQTPVQSYHYVTGLDPNGYNWLALRRAPSSSASWSTTPMGPNTLLSLLGRQGEWLNVRLLTGEEGWANSRFVACCVSAPPTTTALPGSFATVRGRDIVGGDLMTMRAVAGDSCAAACRTTPQCRGYSHDHWNDVCTLKSAVSTLRLEPRAVSGITDDQTWSHATTFPSFQYRTGKGFPQSGYRTGYLSSRDSCSAECLADTRCEAFNYRRSDGFCSLISAPVEYQDAANTEIGIKVQSP